MQKVGSRCILVRNYMTIKSKPTLIIAFILTLIGAGCGQAATQTAEQAVQSAESAVLGKTYDPCALIGIDDMKAYYPGETITIKDDQAKQANAVGQRICFFDIGDDMKFVQLSIVQTAEMAANVRSGGQNAETIYAQEKQLVKDAEAVSGLGDEAYYGGSGLGLGKGTHVLVKGKGLKFNIDIGLGFGNTDKQKHLDIERDLAEKILKRL